MKGCTQPCCEQGSKLCWHQTCQQSNLAPFGTRKDVSRHRLNTTMHKHTLCYILYGPQKCHGCLFAPRPVQAPEEVLCHRLLTKSIDSTKVLQARNHTCIHRCSGPQRDQLCPHKTATDAGIWKHACMKNLHPNCSPLCPGYQRLPKEVNDEVREVGRHGLPLTKKNYRAYRKDESAGERVAGPCALVLGTGGMRDRAARRPRPAGF
jgi:hypothetical protein